MNQSATAAPNPAEATKPAAVVVLAAGQGTRMKSATPKVLHPVCGLPLLGHALRAATGLDPNKVAVVVRHERDRVAEYALTQCPDALIVDQDAVPGTGRAAQEALAALDAASETGRISGPVVLMASDAPMLDAATLAQAVNEQARTGAAVAMLTTRVPDPTGYGRVVRGPDGTVAAIVEQKEATSEQRAINEVNVSVYVADAAFLRDALAALEPAPVSGELYVTDIVGAAVAKGLPVRAVVVDDARLVESCNDRAQLADLGAEMNRRIVHQWMLDGVTVADPATTWIDADVRLEPDVTLLPGVQLRGRTTVATGATVGPDSTLTDMVIGAGAMVERTHGSGSEIGAGANVGPFTFIRPGTKLGANGKIGAYCETKNAVIGDASKVPHLSYVGDAVIGTGTNIGAATIFANYDGVAKHHSKVGDQVRVGSDTVIVAPVTIGDGAYTAAGSVVTEDVPAGALAVARGKQHNAAGWTERRRAGTASAQAAASAQ